MLPKVRYNMVCDRTRISDIRACNTNRIPEFSTASQLSGYVGQG